MFRLIYRQRRRLAFGTFLITLALFMFLMDALNIGELYFTENDPTWLLVATLSITLFVCGLVALVVFCAWLVIFPNWRFMIEQFSLVLFIFQAFDALWPAHSYVPYIGDFIPIIAFFVIFMNAYGTALDRFPIALGMTTTRKYKSSKSAETLWGELVPLPDNKADHWDSLLSDIEADPATGQQKVTYNHGASIYQFQRQSFTELEAPHRATYRFDGDVSDANKPIIGGTYEVLIDPIEGKGAKVTLRESHDALLPRVAIQAWFDDSLGDVTDTLRAREKGKSGWSLTDRYRRKVASLS